MFRDNLNSIPSMKNTDNYNKRKTIKKKKIKKNKKNNERYGVMQGIFVLRGRAMHNNLCKRYDMQPIIWGQCWFV